MEVNMEVTQEVPTEEYFNIQISDLENQIIQGIELNEEFDIILFFEHVIDSLYEDLKKYYPESVRI
jgi:hypothetical protein